MKSSWQSLLLPCKHSGFETDKYRVLLLLQGLIELSEDFPNSLVEIFNVLRNTSDLLNTSIVSQQSILDIRVPKAYFNQVLN